MDVFSKNLRWVVLLAVILAPLHGAVAALSNQEIDGILQRHSLDIDCKSLFNGLPEEDAELFAQNLSAYLPPDVGLCHRHCEEDYARIYIIRTLMSMSSQQRGPAFARAVEELKRLGITLQESRYESILTRLLKTPPHLPFPSRENILGIMPGWDGMASSHMEKD